MRTLVKLAPLLLAAALTVGLLGIQHARNSPGAHAAAVVVRATSSRPNVVMVMADDMRADDLRFMPAVRRLFGATGLTYRNSFSPYPLCCPARASFLSGQYAHNHGVLYNQAPWGFEAFDDSATIATALHQAGYHTGFVGKYLNGYGRDDSLVTGSPSWRYVPAGWTDWHGAVSVPQRLAKRYPTGDPYNYFHTIFNINGRIDDRYRGQYQTNVLGRFGRGLVRRFSPSSDPFFLYLSFVAPHSGAPHEPDDVDRVRRGRDTFTFPTPARPRWVKGRFDRQIRRSPGVPKGNKPSEGDITDKPRGLRNPELNARERALEVAVTRQRAEALAVLDRQVAALVRTLRQEDELANTVLMFTSDNGYFLGEHRFRSGKTKGYEPSLRVPLLVTGPGVPHGVRTDPAMTPDLTATILDLANAQPPRAADGVSLVPGFEGDLGWTAPVVTEAMVKEVRSTTPAAGFHDARNSIGVRTARWKLLRYITGEVELYDLDHDPNELHNLATDPSYAEVLRELDEVWWRYKDCVGAACQAPLPADLRQTAAETARSTLRQEALVRARYGVNF